jgi:hypothetical protein
MFDYRHIIPSLSSRKLHNELKKRMELQSTSRAACCACWNYRPQGKIWLLELCSVGTKGLQSAIVTRRCNKLLNLRRAAAAEIEHSLGALCGCGVWAVM